MVNVTASANDTTNAVDVVYNFEAWFTTAASVSALVGTVVNVLLAGHVHNWYRLVVGHLLVLPVLVVSAVLALVDTDQCE